MTLRVRRKLFGDKVFLTPDNYWMKNPDRARIFERMEEIEADPKLNELLEVGLLAWVVDEDDNTVRTLDRKGTGGDDNEPVAPPAASERPSAPVAAAAPSGVSPNRIFRAFSKAVGR